MPEQRSWCCGFIPRFWWWCLALLGLPLLFVMMTYFHQGVVENDLTTRVGDELAKKDIDWVEVDIDQRGRDVLLKGTAPSEAERDRALSVAQGVYGVNRVDFDSESGIAEIPLTMPTLEAKLTDGKLMLDGQVASQQQVDALVTAATQRFGDENVASRLTVGENVDSPEWLASADDLFSILPDSDVALGISEQGVAISGKVDSDAVKQAMLTRANSLLGGEVIDNIEVRSLLPAELEMAMTGETLTLTGKVSPAQADVLVQAATQRIGEGNVVNALEVSEGYADADWMNAVQQFITGALDDKGGAKIVGDTLEINAEVESEAARDQLIAKSSQAFKGSGLLIVHNILIKVPPPSAAELAAKVCQEKLDIALQGKKILFRVGGASIRNESHALLDQLADIVTVCKDSLVGKRLAIGGHTDSDGSDAYNLQLSQSRADAVGKYLKKQGVPDGLIETTGFGETQAVASNDTAEGKAQNRRISFEIKSVE